LSKDDTLKNKHFLRNLVGTKLNFEINNAKIMKEAFLQGDAPFDSDDIFYSARKMKK